ncbi:unnamed protein product, partial [Diplocarpon coronariae]
MAFMPPVFNTHQ